MDSERLSVRELDVSEEALVAPEELRELRRVVVKALLPSAAEPARPAAPPIVQKQWWSELVL